jgi:hypothetical protein
MAQQDVTAAQRPRRIHLRGDTEAPGPGPGLVLALCGRIVASRASLSPEESDRSSLDRSFFCVKCVEARARGEPPV